MMKNKKGVELSLNTAIIAILLVLVLIVVIGFFLGGTAKAKGTITDIFSRSTEGTDVDIALVQCQSWCEQAKSRPAGELRTGSAFCTKTFVLDIQPETAVKCSDSLLNVKCLTSEGTNVCSPL